MRLREFIFLLTGVSDAGVRDALSVAWRERSELNGSARTSYSVPDAARGSRRAMLAWVLLTLSQDEPNFFALGALALLTLPVFALLTLLSFLVRQA